MQVTAHKVCGVCGRSFAWRKKWERDWDRVRYCSKACRSRGVTARDRDFESMIVSMLSGRSEASSVCPSEVARVSGVGRWRELMEEVRMAARRLASRDVVRITQGGRVVDPSRARGPIRLARGTAFDSTKGASRGQRL